MVQPIHNFFEIPYISSTQFLYPFCWYFHVSVDLRTRTNDVGLEVYIYLMKNKMNLVCGIYVPFTYHPPIAIAEFLSILGTNLFHQNHSTKCYTVFSYGQSPQSHVIFMPCTWCKCLSIPSKYLVSFQIIQCFFFGLFISWDGCVCVCMHLSLYLSIIQISNSSWLVSRFV